MNKNSSRVSHFTSVTTILFSLLLLTVLLGTVTVASAGGTGVGTSLTSGTVLNPHVPIRIDGDQGLVSQATGQGWPGVGSVANPFMIENLEVNATGSFYGIYLGNVTLSFTVSSCSVSGAIAADTDDYPYHYGAGIEVLNDSGTVKVPTLEARTR